ncbi:hypothetical protein RGO69_003277 [Morganella morganii]|nr:hypothetical protein [Morganella morganii]
MANKTKRVIHAGGIFPNPMLNREGLCDSDTLPGNIGLFNDKGRFTLSVDGKEQSILYVANIDYLRCQTVDDVMKGGIKGYVIAIHPLAGMFLNVRAAAGTYRKGDPVIVANGQITAAAGDDAPFAYIEEDTDLTVTAGELVRIVFK